MFSTTFADHLSERGELSRREHPPPGQEPASHEEPTIRNHRRRSRDMGEIIRGRVVSADQNSRRVQEPQTNANGAYVCATQTSAVPGVRSSHTSKSRSRAANLALHHLFEPGTFDNRYVTVGGDILQFLHNPGRPANFHAICRFVGTQTEMSRSSAR